MSQFKKKIKFLVEGVGHHISNFPQIKNSLHYPILIIHSASTDASADKSAAKYSEMSAILGFFRYIWPTFPSL